jgi:hypothetical protein
VTTTAAAAAFRGDDAERVRHRRPPVEAELGRGGRAMYSSSNAIEKPRNALTAACFSFMSDTSSDASKKAG